MAVYPEVGLEFTLIWDIDLIKSNPAVGKDVQTKLVTLYTKSTNNQSRGIIIVKRLNDSQNVIVDIVNAIGIIGSKSRYKFCNFLSADNIYKVYANRDCVIVKVDTESG